ncbi:hypothetical protein ACWCQS_05405, partial [Streptomyces sp. NPDC002076]
MDELVERVDDQDRVWGVVVSRRQAIREGWLHRVAVTVCRDERGRILVHRRSEQLLAVATIRGAVPHAGPRLRPRSDERVVDVPAV